MSKLEDITKQTEYDRVKCWHDAGITGKGVVIWDMENDKAEHGKMTRERCLDSAPGATVINTTYYATSSKDTFEPKVEYMCKRYKGEEGLETFIKRHNIKICTRSIGGGLVKDNDRPEALFWKRMQEKYGIIMFTSAGNTGSDKSYLTELSIVVGACGFLYDKVTRRNYSSYGEGIDFIDFTGWANVYEGTSFSAPYLAGKCALLVQKYGHSAVNQHFAYEYFKSHCEDLQTIGEDIYTGWGLVKMGDVKTVIKMQLGNKTMTIDGRKIEIDQPPIQKRRTNRTVVPVRAIAEAFGAEVLWDEKTKMVTIIRS